ncbi:MAG TPA: hypothetical protein VLC12_05925 [Terriglobales bacterium]|nr:hypothetical protein [Terriglobales bacterium]
MKNLLLLVLLLLCLPLLASREQNVLSRVDKLHLGGRYDILVVQDGDTGARCYVVTDSDSNKNESPSAISCLPKATP